MSDINQTFEFKTNINCGGCKASVSKVLDDAEGICHWDVDTQNKDKLLTVHSKGITPEEVIHKVKDAGFSIEFVNQ